MSSWCVMSKLTELRIGSRLNENNAPKIYFIVLSYDLFMLEHNVHLIKRWLLLMSKIIRGCSRSLHLRWKHWV